MKKVGFDIHGAIDAYPKVFTKMGEILVASGCEVHVITGSPAGPEVEAELEAAGMKKDVNYTHFFSILDYHEELGNDVQYDKHGRGWLDNEIWNKTKAVYCSKYGIDLMIDDSPEYHKHFDLDNTMYCLVQPKD